MDIHPGTVIDKFEVVELLGQGAMASVYLVRHVHLDAPYALKVLKIHRPEVAQRLLTEGRVQAALRHPNVVGVSDVILVDGQPGLVLEFVDGPTLESFIKDYGPLTMEQIDSIALSICKGLRAAHRSGSLHRDLKPANILMDYLDDHWIPKIADFGLAKYVFGGDGEVSVTRTGQIMGSPTFMSPEQCRDAKAVDERADVFALGAVVYELATEQRCFDAPDVVSVFARIVSGAFVPVSDLRPDLPMRMVSAIHGALVVDLEHRIPDVDTFMAVWRGDVEFEANSVDATQSVVALLVASASGTYATLSRPSMEAMKVPEKKKSRLRPTRLVGSMAFLSLFGALAIGAMFIGFVAVFLGGWYLQPGGSLQGAPVEPVALPDPVDPVALPEPIALPEPVVSPSPIEAPAPSPVKIPLPEAVKVVRPAPLPAPAVPVVNPEPSVAPPVPEPPVTKTFSLGLVHEVLSAHPGVRICLDEAKKAGVVLPKHLKVRFVVSPSGRVNTASLEASALARGPLEQCIRRAMSTVVFDPAPDTFTKLTYPLRP